MTMVTVTEIESWRRCRRKRDLSSLNRHAYTPIWPKMNTLGLGSLVHQAGEAWLNQPNPTATNTMFSDLFYEAGKALYAHLMVVCDKTNYRHTDRQEQEFWEAITLGRHMCQNYQDFWHTPLPQGYVLVRPEQQAVVPIPGTEHCGCIEHPCQYGCLHCVHHWASLTGRLNLECHCGVGDAKVCPCVKCHYLEGTLDAIIGDQAGRLFTYERKTFGQHPTIEHLNRVFQFVAYSWILREVIRHWGTNNELAGLLYDGMWKREKPPATGKWANSTESLFLRHYIIHNPEKLDEFEQELVHDVMDMTNPNSYITHTIPAVRGCIDCDFVELCDRMSNGEDTTLMLRTLYTKRDLTPAFKEFYATTAEVE